MSELKEINIDELKEILGQTTKIYDIKNDASDEVIVRELQMMILKILNANDAIVWIFDKEAHKVYTLDSGNKEYLEFGENVLTEAFLTKEVMFENQSKYFKVDDSLDACEDNFVRSSAFFPILKESEVIGVVEVVFVSKCSFTFDEKEIDAIVSLNDYIAQTIALVQKKPQSQTEHAQIVSTQASLELDMNMIATNALYSKEFLDDILNTLKSVAGDKKVDATLKQKINNSSFNLNILQSTLEDIQDYAKGTQGKLEIPSDDIDMEHELQNMLDMVCFHLKKRNIDFSLFIDPALPRRASINKSELMRVVNNFFLQTTQIIPNQSVVTLAFEFDEPQSLLILKTTYDSAISLQEIQNISLATSLKVDTEPNHISVAYPLHTKYYEPIENPKPLRDLVINFLVSDAYDFMMQNIKRYLLALGATEANFIDVERVEDVDITISTHLVCSEDNFLITPMKKLTAKKVEIVMLKKGDFYGYGNLFAKHFVELDSCKANLYNIASIISDEFEIKASMPKRSINVLLAYANAPSKAKLKKTFTQIGLANVLQSKDTDSTIEAIRNAYAQDKPIDLILISENMPKFGLENTVKSIKDMQTINNLDEIPIICMMEEKKPKKPPKAKKPKKGQKPPEVFKAQIAPAPLKDFSEIGVSETMKFTNDIVEIVRLLNRYI